MRGDWSLSPSPAGGEAGPSLRTQALYLLGIAGLAFSIALMFIEMRAVLDVGGSCADGGPYVSAQPCPDGTWLMFVAIFGGFGWGALAFATGVGIGGRFAAMPFLWWPALFCGLGFNFLQYGVAPAGGGGAEWGFLIPGVLFELMGAIPLVLALKYGGSMGADGRERLRQAQLAAGLRPGGSSATDGRSYATLSEALGGLGADGSRTAGSAADAWSAAGATPEAAGATSDAAGGRDLAGELERLADLHDRGALTDGEFAAAKAALLSPPGPESAS